MIVPEFLYHYYELANGPFRNITQNDFENAVNIQKNITEGWNSSRPSNYIELRFGLEEKLKKEFIRKGGKPNRNDPFYFTLGPCEWAKSWYTNPGTIQIPLSDFEVKHLSFTYPDSMISFQLDNDPKFVKYRKPMHGKVFVMSEIHGLIGEYGLPSEEQWKNEEKMKFERYIEVQVWDDFIVNKYKKHG